MKYFLGNPTSAKILQTPHEKLRLLGLSQAKIKYIKALSSAVEEKKITFRNIGRKENQRIIDELTSIKGIGIWTAHMFLIFVLGRLDVLAVTDLGIRKSIMLNFGMKNLPTKFDIEKLATKNNWHPYESVACWYLWKSLDSN